jgi:hypothetical protein
VSLIRDLGVRQHLQAFIIISKEEAKVIHMIHIQELDDSPERTEKGGKKI